MPKVYVRFPKTGLGNMLLVWANALLFAKLNGLPLITGSWWGLRWGALLRRERRKRLYYGYFVESSLQNRLQANLLTFLPRKVRNPEVIKMPAGPADETSIYVFDEVITHEQLFFNLEPYRDFIKDQLYSIIHCDLKRKLSNYTSPVIGVHIRRGDFKATNQTTSIEFFIEAIKACRTAAGADLPVTIFTDAEKHELAMLLLLPAVTISEPKADILDILLLSQSRFLILSQSSSFSYWAAFLSDATVILKHDDWQERIKQDSQTYLEIRFDARSEEGIKALQLKLAG